jgi:hypothetical protein
VNVIPVVLVKFIHVALKTTSVPAPGVNELDAAETPLVVVACLAVIGVTLIVTSCHLPRYVMSGWLS